MDKAQREIYYQVVDSDNPKEELKVLIEFMLALYNTYVDNDKKKVCRDGTICL